MKQLKAFGFDYGGVIEGKPSQYFDEMVCRFINVDMDVYRRTYFATADITDDNGELLSSSDRWDNILEQLDRIDKKQALMTAIKDYKVQNKQINQGVVEIIRRLKERGYRVGILTNRSAESAERIRLEKTHLLFDSFMVSAEQKLKKPDPELYTRFADSLGITIHELAYVDDTAESLSTSEEAGYTPILFVSSEQLDKDLRALGVDI